MGGNRGSRHGLARLNEAAAERILIDLAEGVPVAHLARRYRVTDGTIRHVATGRAWSHVRPDLARRATQEAPGRPRREGWPPNLVRAALARVRAACAVRPVRMDEVEAALTAARDAVERMEAMAREWRRAVRQARDDAAPSPGEGPGAQ